MDLPTCPSCGQSVLDDDAADCPFCGASMSGKGGGGGAPAKSSSAARTPAKKKEEADSGPPKSDDPFDVAAPVMTKAVQLQPKPSKGRLHRVVCPMCETPGFHSKKVAGREVRCANKECKLPLFDAPPLEQEKVAEPEPQEKKGPGIGVYAAIVAVAVAGIGAWQYFQGDDGPAPNPNEQTFDPSKLGNPVDVATQPGEEPKDNDNGEDPPVAAVVDAGPPAAELRKQALDWMYNLSLEANSNRKPYCRRLAAEAWALQGAAGNAKVTENLNQLSKTGGPGMAYQQILPLVEVAWHALGAGNDAEVAKIVEGLGPHLDKLPPQGMLAVDTVTEMAVLHAALGQTDQARAVLQSRHNAGPLGQLMESLSRARFTGIPFETVVSMRPALGWADPQAVAVTVGLAARGRNEQAAAWAETPECIAAWSETQILKAGSAEGLPAIQQRGQGLAPVDRARFLSRIGMALDVIGADAEASAVLASAREALTSLGTPGPVARADLKERRQYSLPDVSAQRNAALAALDVAQLELAVNGEDAAWTSIETALAQTRGMAPSVTDARQPFVEIEQFTANGVMAQLKAQYGLQTDDEVRNEFRLYRDRILRQLRAAESRFALQARVLTVVCEWGLVDKVWAEMQSRATVELSRDNEPWFESPVAAIVRDWFRYSQQADAQAEVERLAATVKPPNAQALWAPRYATGLYAWQAVEEDNSQKLASMLNQFSASYTDEADLRWQQETLMRALSKFVQAGKSQVALKFVEKLADLQIRMEAAELLGAEITASGDRKTVLSHVRINTMTYSDRVALLRGFLERLPDDPPPAAPESENQPGA